MGSIYNGFLSLLFNYIIYELSFFNIHYKIELDSLFAFIIYLRILNAFVKVFRPSAFYNSNTRWLFILESRILWPLNMRRKH